MTDYERGFLAKCAEYGVPPSMSVGMLKRSMVINFSKTRAPEILKQQLENIIRNAPKSNALKSATKGRLKQWIMTLVNDADRVTGGTYGLSELLGRYRA